jgi:hypothetical protein
MGKRITTSIKTARPVSQSELLKAIQGSLGPVFDHFEEQLLKGDGKRLDICITAKAGKIRLYYGVSPMKERTPKVKHAEAAKITG